MRVITYVNGILTVIRENDFFKEEAVKPPFIVGNSFYYEPTLQSTDNRPLTSKEVHDAEAFIHSFMFNVISEPIEYRRHCVDSVGNYLGFKMPEQHDIVVSSAPVDNKQGRVWDFKTNVWVDCILYDVSSGTLIGGGISTLFENVAYLQESRLIEGFCLDVQVYDVSNDVVYVDIEKLRTKKLFILTQSSKKKATEITGETGAGEMSSWKIQEEEAKVWTLDNIAHTPFIDGLLVSRDMGETKAELVAKILSKSEQFKVAYSSYLGFYHKTLKLIETTNTIEGLKAIEVNQ